MSTFSSSAEKVVCPDCGKLTTRKKRCMFCFALLPQEEQSPLGGMGRPYWQKPSSDVS